MKYINRFLTVLSMLFIISTLSYSAYSLLTTPHGNVIKNEPKKLTKKKAVKPSTYYTYHLKLDLPNYNQNSSGFFIRFNKLNSNFSIIKYCKPVVNPEYEFSLPKATYVAEVFTPINQDNSIYDTEPPIAIHLSQDRYHLQKYNQIINPDYDQLSDTLSFITDLKSHVKTNEYDSLMSNWRVQLEQNTYLPKDQQSQILNKLK